MEYCKNFPVTGKLMKRNSIRPPHSPTWKVSSYWKFPVELNYTINCGNYWSGCMFDNVVVELKCID